MAQELIELGRSCPRGKIRRKGYRRKDGTRVKSACVPDKGKPGKTPISERDLPKPKKGHLRGWHANESASKRHAALKKWVRKTNCKKTIGKLTLLRNISPDRKVDRAAKADAKWLHDQDFCKLKTKK